MANEVLVEFRGNAKELLEALEHIKEKGNSLEKQFEILQTAAGALFAGAAIAEIKLSTEAFGKQEAAIRDLTASMQAQGIFSAALKEEYIQTAEALEKKTGVDNEAILTGQALLQTMIGQVPISKELTASIVDLAARSGKDLKGAFEAVGLALNGRVKGLQAFGVEIDATADRQTRMAQIEAQLGQATAGAAAEQVKGLGSLKLVAVAYEDLQKKVGQDFAPAISKAGELLAHFLQVAGEHQGLVDLFASVTAGAAVAGTLAAGIGAAGLAFIKYKEAMAAATIATETMSVVTKGLIGATGIGLLLIIASEIYLNWNKIWPVMQATYTAFVKNITAITSGLGEILAGAFALHPERVQAGINQVKAALAKGLLDYEAASLESNKKIEEATKAHEEEQNAAQKRAADKREALRREDDARRNALIKAQNELQLAEAENASAASIALKKQEVEILTKLEGSKNATIRSSLQTHLAAVRKLEEDQKAQDLAKQKVFDSTILANQKNFEGLSESQKRVFLQKNRALLQSSIDTQGSAQEKADLKKIQDQIRSHNQLLADQIEFGAAYAQINEIMHSAVVQGSAKAFGNLEQLTQSHNDALKTIGKAAAIANITIKTAESAMEIYAGFAAIPIIGPILGAIGAAAAVAFGAEQIGQVTAAADGGLLTGGIPGVDSIPLLGMPGELVVPTKNYEEVVGAVANQRAAQQSPVVQSSASVQHVMATLEIRLKDKLGEFVELSILQRQRLGISLLPRFT